MRALWAFVLTGFTSPSFRFDHLDVGGDDLASHVLQSDLRQDIALALSALGYEPRRLDGDPEAGADAEVDTAKLGLDGRRAAVDRVDAALAARRPEPGIEPPSAERRRRWTEVRAERDRLMRDALAVACWLEVRHPRNGATVRVDTTRDEPRGEVMQVIIAGPGDPARCKALWREACRAFVALRWAITGGRESAHIYLPNATPLTNHARLQAYARVERELAR